MTYLKKVMHLLNINRRAARQIIHGWDIYYKNSCKRNEKKISFYPLKHKNRFSKENNSAIK